MKCLGDGLPALRFLIAGHVDDGKSTLTGRLLMDNRAVFSDQFAGILRDSCAAEDDEVNLALLADGLQAEREQGITIDVAYRYFSTAKRRFVIADAPGHEQYICNMVTAASNCDAIVILVDVTKLQWRSTSAALFRQTCRHAVLAHLLRIPSLVFAVNKLDAVKMPDVAFENVRLALQAFAKEAGLDVTGIVPISALKGFNVSQPASDCDLGRWPSWYQGPSLLDLLSGLPVTADEKKQKFYFPVQWVEHAKAPSAADFPLTEVKPCNGYAVLWGRIAAGAVHVGDDVMVQPSGEHAKVMRLAATALGGQLQKAQAGVSVGIVLDKDKGVSRGDWLTAPDSSLQQEARVVLVWFDQKPLVTGSMFWAKHGHRWVKARVRHIHYRLDMESLKHESACMLKNNDIGGVTLFFEEPLVLLPYAQSRQLGALILVDMTSNNTAGAAMIEN